MKRLIAISALLAAAIMLLAAPQQSGSTQGSTGSVSDVPGPHFVVIDQKTFDDELARRAASSRYVLTHDRSVDPAQPRFMLMRDQSNTYWCKMNPTRSAAKGAGMAFMEASSSKTLSTAFLLKCEVYDQDDTTVLATMYYRSVPPSGTTENLVLSLGPDYRHQVRRIKTTMLPGDQNSVFVIEFSPPAWNKRG